MAPTSADMMQPERNLSLLLKSPPGFGKTIAACSLAIDGPVYLAYFDKRQPVELLNFYKKYRPQLLKNIRYEVFSSRNAHDYLNTLMDFVTKGCPYVAVITDSATNLTSAAINWSMGFKHANGSREKNPRNNPLRDSDTPQMVPDFDDYKAETSLVTQALDILTSLPVHNIWTAHPVPSLKVEDSGSGVTVTKVTNIVTYGQKVGAMIPGRFNEIYHFAKRTGFDQAGKYSNRHIVLTDMVGDDFAKTSFNLPREIDITDQLFWEVMKPLYLKAVEEVSTKEETKTESNTLSPEVKSNDTAKYPWMK